MSRRLEDKIRDLCNRAVSAGDVSEVKAACSELRAALNQYVARLRARVVDYSHPVERRSQTYGRDMPEMPDAHQDHDDQE